MGLRYGDLNYTNHRWICFALYELRNDTFQTEFKTEVGIAELTAAERSIILLRQVSLVEMRKFLAEREFKRAGYLVNKHGESAILNQKKYVWPERFNRNLDPSWTCVHGMENNSTLELIAYAQSLKDPYHVY